MASHKLTTAQKRELENLYNQKTVWVGSITPKTLVNTLNKLIEYGYAEKTDRAVGADITLTPDGIQLAEYRFGDSTPDPTPSDPAPVATEPSPVVAESAHAETVAIEFEDHSHFQEYMGIEQKQGIALPNLWAKLLDIAAEDDIYPAPDVISVTEPVAAQSVSKVTWLTMDDVPMPQFRNALHRVIEKTNGSAHINYYELRFTPDGQAWADVQFGSSTPDPTPTDPAPVATEPRFVVEAIKHLQYRVRDTKTGEFANTPRKIYTNYALACEAANVIASEPAPVATKRNLSFQEASDLLAENPARTDVKLMYSQVRTVTNVIWTVDGSWDVIASGFRYGFSTKEVVSFLWQEINPAPADDETSEPSPVVAESAHAEPVAAPRYLVEHEAWKGYIVTDSATGEPKSNHTSSYKVAKVIARNLNSEPVAAQSVSKVTWLTMDDVPMPQFRNALHRATFMTWRDGLNAPTTAVDKPTRDLKPRKVSSIANMQKNREYTGKMRKAVHREWLAKHGDNVVSERRIAPAPKAPKQTLRETVLEIVSHLETPLAPQTERRIA